LNACLVPGHFGVMTRRDIEHVPGVALRPRR
jgi:hypothetical protein